MRIAAAIVTVTLGGLLLPAQTLSPIEKQGRYWVQTEEGSIPALSRLEVTSTGSITVEGDTAGQIRYRVVKKLRADGENEARQLFEQARVEARRNAPTVRLELNAPRCFRCGFTADFHIRAPQTTQFASLETAGGALAVANLRGNVEAETAGGSISAREIGGSLRAETAGGGISLGAIGGKVTGETAGGSIDLDQAGSDAQLTTSGGSIAARTVAGSLRAETAGGSIRAETVNGDVSAATSGGSIHLGKVGGRVDAETAGGSIYVGSAPGGVSAETAGGEIELENVSGAVQAANAAGSIRARFLGGHPLKDSILATNSGTIVVWIPVNLAVNVDATVDLAGSLSRIESEFDALKVRRESEGFGPATVTAAGPLNGGGPVLTIRNISGRIRIRKGQ